MCNPNFSISFFQAPPSDMEKVDVTMIDHPLNPNPTSQWATYFKDNAVLLQIDKDVRRLCPDLNFFQVSSFSKD